MPVKKLDKAFTHQWECSYCGNGFYSDAPGIYELTHGASVSCDDGPKMYSVSIHITPALPTDSASKENTQFQLILCLDCVHKVLNIK